MNLNMGDAGVVWEEGMTFDSHRKSMINLMVDEIKVLRIQTLWLIYVNDMKHFLFTFFIFF